METTLCPRCSKAMPGGATFCRRCGQSLRSVGLRSELVYTPVGAGGPPPGGPGRRGPTAALVVAVMCGVGVSVLMGVLWSSPSRTFSSRPIPAVRVQPVPSASLPPAKPSLPPLPSLPAWMRHLPDDLPPKGSLPEGRDFRGQLLSQNRFGQERLAAAVFAGAQLSQVSFEKADLRGADFRGAEFSQCTLAGADIGGARFDGASFSQSYLTSIDVMAVAGKTRTRNGVVEPVPPPPLPARNAGKASFRNVRFGHTDFERMDLAGADFRGAEFSGGRFTDADLRGADLRDTRHNTTDFKGANLDDADLRGADLTSARNLSDAQLAVARTDETTRRPRR